MDGLEKIAKWTTGIVAVLYAIGFLVTNQYLSSIGASDFTSLEPRFVITGSWAALILLLFVAPGLGFGFVMYEKDNQKKWDQWKLALWWGLGYLGLALAARFLSLWSASPQMGAREMIVRLLHLAALVGVACLAVMLVGYGLERSASLNEKHRGSAILLLILIIVLVATGFFVATNTIATRAYARIPDALGGGKPVDAQLLLNPDGVTFWRQTGAVLPAAKDSMATGPIKILHESEHELVVSAPYQDGGQLKTKIIVLKKDIVNGIVP